MNNTTRKYREWTDEDLIIAVKKSRSIAQTLRYLNLQPVGGNYRNIKRNIDRLQLDTSHFTGQSWNKDSYRNLGELSSPQAIKRLLIKTRGHQCEDCKFTQWKNEQIKLELHHKDGNIYNNLDNNLLLLCPNCHSFTHNFKGRKNK